VAARRLVTVGAARPRTLALVMTAVVVLACGGMGVTSCGKGPIVLIRVSRAKTVGPGVLSVALNSQPVDNIPNVPSTPDSIGLGYMIHPENAKVSVSLTFTAPNGGPVLDMTELPWTGQIITWVVGGPQMGAGG